MVIVTATQVCASAAVTMMDQNLVGMGGMAREKPPPSAVVV
jgi:hypothetical protein